MKKETTVEKALPLVGDIYRKFDYIYKQFFYERDDKLQLLEEILDEKKKLLGTVKSLMLAKLGENPEKVVETLISWGAPPSLTKELDAHSRNKNIEHYKVLQETVDTLFGDYSKAKESSEAYQIIYAEKDSILSSLTDAKSELSNIYNRSGLLPLPTLERNNFIPQKVGTRIFSRKYNDAYAVISSFPGGPSGFFDTFENEENIRKDITERKASLATNVNKKEHAWTQAKELQERELAAKFRNPMSDADFIDEMLDTSLSTYLQRNNVPKDFTKLLKNTAAEIPFALQTAKEVMLRGLVKRLSDTYSHMNSLNHNISLLWRNVDSIRKKPELTVPLNLEAVGTTIDNLHEFIYGFTCLRDVMESVSCAYHPHVDVDRNANQVFYWEGLLSAQMSNYRPQHASQNIPENCRYNPVNLLGLIEKELHLPVFSWELARANEQLAGDRYARAKANETRISSTPGTFSDVRMLPKKEEGSRSSSAFDSDSGISRSPGSYWGNSLDNYNNYSS